jgi:hypothetical protein
MKRILNDVIVPATLPAIFFLVAAVPVQLLPCGNRRLIAALVAIAAGILGVVAAVKALMGKLRGDADSSLWMASTLILAIPAISVVLSAI